MACGVAPVASNIGMNREIIADGHTGYLVDTEEEWKIALGRLIQRPNLRYEMGQRARNSIVQRYSSDVLGNRFVNFVLDES